MHRAVVRKPDNKLSHFHLRKCIGNKGSCLIHCVPQSNSVPRSDESNTKVCRTASVQISNNILIISPHLSSQCFVFSLLKRAKWNKLVGWTSWPWAEKAHMQWCGALNWFPRVRSFATSSWSWNPRQDKVNQGIVKTDDKAPKLQSVTAEMGILAKIMNREWY